MSTNMSTNINIPHKNVKYFIGTPGKDVTPQQLNLLTIYKFFYQVKDQIELVKRYKNGKILVKLIPSHHNHSNLVTHLLEKTTDMFGHKISFAVPPSLNLQKGIISHMELRYLSTDEVLELTKEQGVLFVKKTNNPNTYNVFFASVPDKITVGWDTVIVKKPPLMPLRCSNCCKYGHRSVVCRSATTCPRCSDNHFRQDCTADSLECPACGGQHEVTSSSCPSWKREKAKIYEKNKTNNQESTPQEQDPRTKTTKDSSTQIIASSNTPPSDDASTSLSTQPNQATASSNTPPSDDASTDDEASSVASSLSTQPIHAIKTSNNFAILDEETQDIPDVTYSPRTTRKSTRRPKKTK